MINDQWLDEWPTEPGFYWFYGWTYRKIRSSDYPEKPEMFLVSVRRVKDGALMYVEGHRFLDKHEGAEGKWLKATLPTPPKGIKPR